MHLPRTWLLTVDFRAAYSLAGPENREAGLESKQPDGVHFPRTWLLRTAVLLGRVGSAWATPLVTGWLAGRVGRSRLESSMERKSPSSAKEAEAVVKVDESHQLARMAAISLSPRLNGNYQAQRGGAGGDGQHQRVTPLGLPGRYNEGK